MKLIWNIFVIAIATIFNVAVIYQMFINIELVESWSISIIIITVALLLYAMLFLATAELVRSLVFIDKEEL